MVRGGSGESTAGAEPSGRQKVLFNLPDSFKEKLKFRLFSTLTAISPRLNTQAHFILITGKPIDLVEPKTFSEKLSWLKLNRYASDPLVEQCSDKVRVRDYVSGHGYGYMLNEVYGIYDSPGQIPWEELPEKFVIKWNFGSGFNYICKSKREADRNAAVKQLKKWGRTRFWNYHAELQYKNIPRKLICEKYIDPNSGVSLIDYKFYCFNGKPEAILVISRENGEAESAAFMSLDWEYISDIPYRYKYTFRPEKPGTLREMTQCAERLSEPFPFVRVDFYECQGNAVFGELTFTPAAGIFPSETEVNGKTMGELINITE